MEEGLLGDYCDGSAFNYHPLFSTDPTALQIMLYYDDVEVVNPIGSRTNTHKLGELHNLYISPWLHVCTVYMYTFRAKFLLSTALFYYMLGNIYPSRRSSLKCIQVASDCC